MGEREVNDWIADLTDELIHLAARYPVGTVLERRGDVITPRRQRDV